MNKHQEITEARELLGLSEQASIKQIRSNYRKLINEWHPDKCDGSEEECHEMTRKINAAYRRIMAYCNQYEISFAQSAIDKNLSVEEWWFERFGNDPLWGKGER